MFYLLALLLFIILYYVFVKLLSSIVKGCMMAVFVSVLILLVGVFIKSSREPVYLFDMYKIDNFNVVKLR